MPSYSLSNPLISAGYAAFAVVKAADWGSTANTASSIVFAGALPTIQGVDQASDTGMAANVYVIVGGGFVPQKKVIWARPNSGASSTGLVGGTSDAFADPLGIALVAVDCITPPWPFNQTIPAYNSSGTDQSFMVLNGDLFVCTGAGATTTTTAVAGAIKWNHAQGGTTTDNAATWTCYGRATVLRLVFINNGDDANAPVAQDMWLAQA